MSPKSFYRIKSEYMELSKTIVTLECVKNMFEKLEKQGKIPKNYSIRDMKVILEVLPSAVFYECMRRYPETVNRIEHFALYLKELVIEHTKEILKR